MRHRLLILKRNTKACIRKKRTVITNVIGTSMIVICLLTSQMGNAGVTKIYAEITTAPETGDIWNVTDVKPKVKNTEEEQPSEQELAKDTLCGVPSVKNNNQDIFQILPVPFPTASTGEAIMEEQTVTAFHAEEQNKDLEVMQQKKIQQKTKKIAKSQNKKSKTTISLNKKDKAVLLRIVEAEAGTEDLKGKMLVANVVLNRVNHKNEFPDNVSDVVFDHTGGVYQFSPIGDGRYWSVTISEETKEAVRRVLCGEDESKGALYFMAREYAAAHNVNWFDQSLTRLYKHGGHEFFR